VTGVALSASLFAGFGPLSVLFTDDPAVLDVARSGVWVMTFWRSRCLVSQVMFSDFIFYSYIVAVCRNFSAGECYCFCGRWALLRRFWLCLCRILNGFCSYLYPIITLLVINILSVAWLGHPKNIALLCCFSYLQGLYHQYSYLPLPQSLVSVASGLV
jgi:hypothetical protein